MLGNVNPRALRITSHPVVYSGRDNVTTLTLEALSGRRYVPLDLSGVTRWLLVFPQRDPQVLIDSAEAAVFTVSGNSLAVDLGGYAMDASIQPCWLIAYDAEHPLGQVLVDDNDCVVNFSFREVSGAGLLPLPLAEYVTEAPADGKSYVRKNGAWAEATALVAGVSSVNGFTGDVLLNATHVGADPAGTASAAMAGHLAAGDPHAQYALDTDLSGHVADTTPHAVVTAVDRFGFNTAAGLTAAPGEMVWNATDATVDIGLPGGVTLQGGQEFLIRVLNNTGALLTNLTAVYITGAQGNRTTVAKASGATFSADKTVAVLTQDIANNAEGFATVTGLVRNVDTSAFAEGGEVWLSASTPGAITPTKPTAPANAVLLGYCVRSHATIGSIYVSVRGLGALARATDVTLTSPTNGQVLTYNGSVWVNQAPSGGGVASVDGRTGTVTLSDLYAPASHVGATGAAHGNATGSVAGFMAAADKTKLDGVATGATANATDAQLRDRTTHTGEQAISTVTGLQAALDGKASVAQATQSIIVACSDETTALTVGTGKVTFRMPYAFTLTGVRASLVTAQASGNILTVDINEAGASILSTKLTIDNGEKTSTTAATAAVISDTALADDAEITIDIDQIGDGTAAGLKVTLIGVPA